MYKPRTAIIPGMGTVTPTGDVSAAEWNGLNDKVDDWAQNIPSRTFDVREFGTVGTDDDGPVIKAALDYAAATGGQVVLPNDVHKIKTGFIQPSNTYIVGTGSGSTMLDMSQLETPISHPDSQFTAGIFGSGSMVRIANLTQTARKGASTLHLASVSGLQVGDWLRIFNAASGSFNSARSAYHDGEDVRISSVNASESTITISRGLYAQHGTAVRVYKVTPFRGGMKGVTLVGVNGARVAKYDLGLNLILSDIEVSGSNYAGLEVARCNGLYLDRIFSFDNSVLSGLNYGISIGNSQHVRVRDSYLETSRHGITIGGGNIEGSIPNRDILIQGTYLNGLQTGGGVTGFSPHGNSEFVTLDNCTFPNGITLCGDYITLRNSRIWSNLDGSALYGAEMLGVNHVIENNDWFIQGDYGATPSAPMYIYFDDGAVRDGGTFTMRDNRIHIDGAKIASGMSAWGIHVLKNGGPNRCDFEILNTTIEYEGDIVPAHYGLRMRTTNGPNTWRNITIDGWRGNVGIQITDMSFRSLRLKNIDIKNALGYGIYVTRPNEIYGSPEVLINDVSVIGAQGSGLWLENIGTPNALLVLRDVTALDCGNNTGLANSQRASMYIDGFHTVTRYNAIIGDRQGVPTQVRADTITNASLLVDVACAVIGTVTTQTRSGIGTTRELAIP